MIAAALALFQSSSLVRYAVLGGLALVAVLGFLKYDEHRAAEIATLTADRNRVAEIANANAEQVAKLAKDQATLLARLSEMQAASSDRDRQLTATLQRVAKLPASTACARSPAMRDALGWTGGGK